LTWLPRLRPAPDPVPAADPADPVAHESAVLDDRCAATFHKLVLKDQLADDLKAGRMPLADAVGRYLAIEAERPDLWPTTEWVLPKAFPADRIEESVARNLVLRAQVGATNNPDRQQALAERLDGELTNYLGNLPPGSR